MFFHFIHSQWKDQSLFKRPSPAGKWNGILTGGEETFDRFSIDFVVFFVFFPQKSRVIA